MSVLQSEVYLNDLKLTVQKSEIFRELKDQRILITGATGLICSGVADMLLTANAMLDSNIHIYVAGRSEEKVKARFGDFPDERACGWITFVPYDATKENRLDFTADYVIHGASNAHPKAFVNAPVDTMLSNIFGIRELLDYAKKVQVKNVVYISSSEVYGKKENAAPFQENEYGYLDILNPRNAYASSKRASETLCAGYGKQYGVRSGIVRPGHIYGPTATREDSRVGSSFAYDAAAGRDIVLKSAGQQIRSYCYVLDCATAILQVMLKGEPYRAYNISNCRSILSIRKIAELYAKAGGVSVQFDLPTQAEATAFNPMENSSLNSDALEALGWQGIFDAETGTAHTVSALKETC